MENFYNKDNIHDIIGLTALQEGMLFQYIQEKNTDEYFEQFIIKVHDIIDIDRFKSAWHKVVINNEALRSCFKWERVKQPVQIILKNFYPEIIIEDLKSEIENNIINEDFIFDQENDIFKNSFKESPVDTSNIKGNGYADYRNLDYNDKDKLNCVYLYYFNVGQGDSFLLIPISGNPYIIDINVYKDEHCKQYDKFVEKVKNILLYHRLKRDYIKGLIITHKHTDHCRGGGYFIDNSEIEIENF